MVRGLCSDISHIFIEGWPHAYLCLSGNGGSVILNGLGNAEVNQLELALHQQEVGWLEVRVHNP